MRWLFAGGINDALLAGLRALGEEVHAPHDADWWRACDTGETPRAWADRVAEHARRLEPDVFVLSKGLHFVGGEIWAAPPQLLWWIRQRGAVVVFLCFDDPAITPLLLTERVPAAAHLWGTTCVGIEELFPWMRERTAARVFEFWLAWDERIGEVPAEPDLEVDLAITGTPYYRSFPPPHYGRGFGCPRRDVAREALRRGLRVGLWGPDTWLQEEHGGDPALAPCYRGQLPQGQIHRVHRSARACWASHLVEGRRYESGRIPWTLGAGGFLVHEARPGLADEFGGTVLWHRVGDAVHAVDAVERALAPEFSETRARMVHDGWRLVLERHTWSARARELRNRVGQLRSDLFS